MASYNQEEKNNIFQILAIVIRRYFILLLAVILVFVVSGIFYARSKKQYYEAKEPISYKVDVKTSPGNALNNYKTMSVYIDTVVEFCKQGVVLDRAEYYYDRYLYLGQSSDEKFEDFIDSIESGVVKYDASVHVKESRQHYGNGTTVNTQKIVHNDNTEFTFYLIVRGDSVEEIKDKVRILALAADDEVSESDIFINLETSLVELVSSRNDIEIIKSTEKEQIIIISCVLGVIVALILVFVLNSLDKTVKHKEELEEISKVPVLSFIEEQGGAD